MSTKTTYKQTELGLIPEDWELKKLGKVGEIDKKSLNSNTDKEYEFDYISLSDVDSDQFSIKTSKQKFKNAPSRARRIVKKGDVLLSTVRPNLEGFTIIRDEVKDLIASTGFAVITSKNELHNEYLFNFLFSNIIKRQFHKLLVGSNYPAINSSDVKNLKIPLPPLSEQKKIADCLSTWDCAIEKQSQLINALTQRKKALMQQLLTGKKRLPRFEGKWNLNSINDLFIFKNGKAHENDIDENGKYILVNSKFISTDGEISKKTNSNLAPLEVNDLVFVMSDVPNGKALAKFCLIKEDNLYTLNQRIGLLKIKKGNPIFMYYLLNRNSYFLMFDNGVGQTNLRKDDILDCPLNIPSLSEQTAIAEILATADRELTLQKEKLAQLQTQKKGLMQVLLTGKKRLIN